MTRLPPNVRKVVCYIRKSREDEEAEQRGEDTLSKQRDMMQKDVLARYDVVWDLAEEVASGDSIRDRPVFRAILSKLGSEYQAVACKDLSRLGRGSYGDMGLVYDLIRDRRIYIITKDAVYDPANFSDLRMIRFSLFFNREEYEMTLWRLTEGKYDGASNGKWVAGSVPYGYRYNRQTQVLEPFDPEASVVRSIFSWYVDESLGLRAIASRLRAFGHKSPRGKEVWQPEVIRRILKNPAHNGTLVFRKTQKNKTDGRVIPRPAEDHIVVEDAFEGLVDEITWHGAQARLEESAARPRSHRTASTRELAGLVTCADCGHRMIRQSSVRTYIRRDGQRSNYQKEFLYCNRCGFAVRYRDCEQRVLQVLKLLAPLDTQLLADHAKTKADPGWQANRVRGEQIESLLAQQANIACRLTRARDYLLDGTLSAQEYLQAKRKSEQALREVEGALKEAGRQQMRTCDARYADAHFDKMLKVVRSITDVYDELENKALRNRLLHSIFAEVRLKLRTKGRGRSRPAEYDLHVILKPGLDVQDA